MCIYQATDVLNAAACRTVLVDDTPLAFLHQPANGVPVLGFRGDPDDRLLLEAVLPLLQVGLWYCVLWYWAWVVGSDWHVPRSLHAGGSPATDVDIFVYIAFDCLSIFCGISVCRVADITRTSCTPMHVSHHIAHSSCRLYVDRYRQPSVLRQLAGFSQSSARRAFARNERPVSLYSVAGLWRGCNVSHAATVHPVSMIITPLQLLLFSSSTDSPAHPLGHCLQNLAGTPDVRSVLERRFDMKNWFKRHGYPDSIWDQQHQMPAATPSKPATAADVAYADVEVVVDDAVMDSKQKERCLLVFDFDKTLTDFDAGGWQ